MTREELLKEIDRERKWLDEAGYTAYNIDIVFSSLYKNIKVLETGPCEDAISRKAIEKLKRWRFSYDDNTTIPKSDLFVKLTDIRDLPPAAPTRKKGKWIDIDKTHSKCDKCESVFEIASANGESNYCPNCGSLMVGDVEESEE